MTEEPSPRWEDVAEVWHGPSYRDCALTLHPSVEATQVHGQIITCADVVDWDGDGGRDVVVSSWDACFGHAVQLYRDQTAAGEPPRLVFAAEVPGITGYVSAIRRGGRLHLLSASRLRRHLHLFVAEDRPGEPRFGPPTVIPLEADWCRNGELIHYARFVDFDGDGGVSLIVGTDYWHDYWPDGVEWNEAAYRPYDDTGRWRGGPLRGHLYRFPVRGDLQAPDIGRGRPILADGAPIEVYGQLAPALADYRGVGRPDLICGSFEDRLVHYPRRADGTFETGRPVRGADGEPLRLGHCIYFPTAVDWTGDGRPDVIVGAEDGRTWLLRHGGVADGDPVFGAPEPVAALGPRPSLGILPVPAIADRTRAGCRDLILGNGTGELLYLPNLADHAPPAYAPPCRLTAGGEPVRVRAGANGSLQGPSEYNFGYTCPTSVDWDGTGRTDLVVGDIFGRYLLYRRAADLEDGVPAFEAPKVLTVDGEALNTVWRVRPAVVDWQGTGVLHLVTPDADGVLCQYRRCGDADLTDKRPLTFRDGEPIRFTEDFGGGRGRVKLCLADWTGDGRFDLIVGTHNRASVPPGPTGIPRHSTGQAGVLLLVNVGDNAEPRFDAPRPFLYDGSPIVLGMHSCAPEPVFWSSTTQPDLLVGAEDGRLLWFLRAHLSW